MFKLDKSNRALLNKACLMCLGQKTSFEECCKPDIRNLAECTSWGSTGAHRNPCSYDRKCDIGLVGTGRMAAKGYRAFGGRDENVLNLNCMECEF